MLQWMEEAQQERFDLFIEQLKKCHKEFICYINLDEKGFKWIFFFFYLKNEKVYKDKVIYFFILGPIHHMKSLQFFFSL
jgi:hypothetical protein